jgi:hypothetical protein
LLAPPWENDLHLTRARIDDGDQLFHNNVAEAAKLWCQLFGGGRKRVEFDSGDTTPSKETANADCCERGRLLRDQLGYLDLLVERQNIGLCCRRLGWCLSRSCGDRAKQKPAASNKLFRIEASLYWPAIPGCHNSPRIHLFQARRPSATGAAPAQFGIPNILQAEDLRNSRTRRPARGRTLVWVLLNGILGGATGFLPLPYERSKGIK